MTDQAEIDRAAVDILERDTYGRGTAMTDEERQKLCFDLRRVLAFKTLCKEAADEIERLAAKVHSLEEVANLNEAEAVKLAEDRDRLAAEVKRIRTALRAAQTSNSGKPTVGYDND